MSLPKPYYEDSAVQIYHADCRDILPELPKVDLVLTDPPYGVNLGNHHAANDKRHKHLHKENYASYDDTPENFKDIILPVLLRCIETSRTIAFTAWQNFRLLPAPDAIGGGYMPMGAGRNPFGFTNIMPALMWGASPTNHLGCKNTMVVVNQQNEPDYGHPCVKPLKIMLAMVDIGSIPGNTVLDPFCGAGTTLRAAKDLGRRAIGIEIEEKYCEIAAKRMAQEVFPFKV